MSRETKLGIIVAGSFICLLGAIVARKLLNPEVNPEFDPSGAIVRKDSRDPNEFSLGEGSKSEEDTKESFQPQVIPASLEENSSPLPKDTQTTQKKTSGSSGNEIIPQKNNELPKVLDPKLLSDKEKAKVLTALVEQDKQNSEEDPLYQPNVTSTESSWQVVQNQNHKEPKIEPLPAPDLPKPLPSPSPTIPEATIPNFPTANGSELPLEPTLKKIQPSVDEKSHKGKGNKSPLNDPGGNPVAVPMVSPGNSTVPMPPPPKEILPPPTLEENNLPKIDSPIPENAPSPTPNTVENSVAPGLPNPATFPEKGSSLPQPAPKDFPAPPVGKTPAPEVKISNSPNLVNPPDLPEPLPVNNQGKYSIPQNGPQKEFPIEVNSVEPVSPPNPKETKKPKTKGVPEVQPPKKKPIPRSPISVENPSEASSIVNEKPQNPPIPKLPGAPMNVIKPKIPVPVAPMDTNPPAVPKNLAKQKNQGSPNPLHKGITVPMPNNSVAKSHNIFNQDPNTPSQAPAIKKNTLPFNQNTVGAKPKVSAPPIRVNTPPEEQGRSVPSAPKVRNYTEEFVTVSPQTPSFEALSQAYYGSPRYARALMEYNKNKSHLNPASSDPSELQVGQRVVIPDRIALEANYPRLIDTEVHTHEQSSSFSKTPKKSTKPSPIPVTVKNSQSPIAKGTGPIYIVQGNREMLYEIARRTLGDSRRWSEIYRLNPQIRPEWPIPRGTRLRLPVTSKVQP